MLTRSYCYFCHSQMDDREPAVQNCTTGAFAHEWCAKNISKFTEKLEELCDKCEAEQKDKTGLTET